MSAVKYRVRVNWDGSAFDFSGPNADITGDVLSFGTKIGRDKTQGKVNAGTADLRLFDKGKFNPYNSSSMLYGKLLPMRAVQIDCSLDGGTTYPYLLYRGWSRTGQSNPDIGGREATIHCEDLFLPLSRVSPVIAEIGPGRHIKNALDAIFDATGLLNLTPDLYWKLAEPSGAHVVADSSGAGHTGYAYIDVVFGQSQKHTSNTSALFNGATTGSQAYITANNYMVGAPGSKTTYMGWAYLTNSTTWRMLVQNSSGGIQVWVNSNAFWFTSNKRNPPVSWVPVWPGNNQWVHWALTYDDSTKTAELFINKVSKGTRTVDLGYSGESYFTVGGKYFTNSWQGYMQEILVFPAVLAPSAIAGVYDATLALTGAAGRAFDNGDLLPGFSSDGSTTALSLISNLMDIAQGVFFQAPSGTGTFYDRNHWSMEDSIGTIALAQATLPGYDLDSVINVVRLTADGGTEQVSINQTSKDEYGEATFGGVGDSSLLRDDQHAADLGQFIVTTYGEPEDRIWDVLVSEGPAGYLPIMLSATLQDTVTLATSLMSGDFIVESIQHKGEGGTLHNTTWGLRVRPSAMPFRLDDAARGLDRAAYGLGY